MKSLTISEMRFKEVVRLAKMHEEKEGNPNEYPTPESIEKARYLMNSFYRLCGLCERNLYLANDERTCNRPSTHASEEREDQWYKRLNNEFNQFAGLDLNYCGYCPSIGITSPTGGFSERISRYFYD